MKLFFITGHGRSGTHYMAALFRHFGFNVGTQQDEADGQSHNHPKDIWPPSKIKNGYQYLIQVVRDPWKVVESTYLAHYSIPALYAMRIPEIKGGTQFENTIRSVVLWNRAIANANPDLVVKVEEAESDCREWLIAQGLSVSAHGVRPPTDVNHRTWKGWNLRVTVPWDEASENVMVPFRQHCRKYGYPDRP